MKTAIILLNWNGADDTIDCLDSLSRAEGSFFVVVVDNDSHDDSVVRLKAWKQSHPELELHLIEEKENHGFAVGNNIGVRYASRLNPDDYMLLNNDTVVEPDFLVQLQSFKESNKDFDVLSPVIYYYKDKNKIWSAGGRLKLTSRASLHRDEDGSVLKGMTYYPVNHVSGCAMLLSRKALTPSGDIFCDKLFFGEEDYEFSLRMKDKCKMACVTGSKIYHKVGMARKKLSKEQDNFNTYIYYLSINYIAGLHHNGVVARLHVLCNYLKAVNKFRNLGNSLSDSLKLSNRLWTESHTRQGIDKEFFEELKQRFSNPQ